jgi:exonuclease SbcC
MITLKSIRIINFRTIKNLTFKPKEEGITGIFGPNGAGKTSILIAVMFALYGWHPKNVSYASLRREGSDTEECSVSVVFTHLNQTVEVIRELNAHNKHVVTIYVNGQKATVDSVGASTKWMTRRLGVDAEGFMTAFVVRQKELDAFVRAVPAERKKIIEKLAGVDTINEALKSSRENEKDSKKILDLLPGSQDQVTSAGEEQDFYSDESQKRKLEQESIRTSLSALNEERVTVSRNMESLRTQQANLVKVQNKINNLIAEIPNLEGQIDRVSYITSVKPGEDVDSLRNKYKTISAELNEHRNTKSRLEHTLSNLNTKAEQLTRSLRMSQERLEQLEQTVDADQNSIAADAARVADRINAINTKTVQLNAQNQDFTESLDMLSHNDECPTCKTSLPNADALRKHFRTIIEENTATLTKITTEQQELYDEANTIQLREKAYKEHQQLTESVEETQQQLDTTQTELGQTQEQITEITIKVVAVEQHQQEVLDLGSKAGNLQKDAILYHNLNERKDTALLELEDARRNEKEISDIFSATELNKLQQKLESLRVEYERFSQQNTEVTAAYAETEIRLQNSRTMYAKAYSQWEKKKNLQEAHASKTLTTDMLEQFRQEMVASIAPEISDYATGLISDMTNGQFVEVRLDEEFKASLVDASGEERQVALLSGGEESAVALALRLAVSFLITGGNPELLWLDEPLTAQDADRRAAILSMIRKLPINQILLINHAQEAQDIVDYEITLTKD